MVYVGIILFNLKGHFPQTTDVIFKEFDNLYACLTIIT